MLSEPEPDNAACALVCLLMCAQASVLETTVKLIKLFDREFKRSANLLTSQTDVQIVSTDDDSDEPEQKQKVNTTSSLSWTEKYTAKHVQHTPC